VSVSHYFKEFFEEFDEVQYQLGIAGYGISITTLEEVFLAVGDGRDFGDHHMQKEQVRKQILAAQGTMAELQADTESNALITNKPLTEDEIQ